MISAWSSTRYASPKHARSRPCTLSRLMQHRSCAKRSPARVSANPRSLLVDEWRHATVQELRVTNEFQRPSRHEHSPNVVFGNETPFINKRSMIPLIGYRISIVECSAQPTVRLQTAVQLIETIHLSYSDRDWNTPMANA